MAVLGLCGGRSGGSGGRPGGGGGTSGGGRAGASGARSSAREGRSDITELDVRVGDGDTSTVSLDISGNTRGGGASTTSDTWGARILIGGVVRVEPEHVDGVIVPNGQNEDTTAGTWAHSRTEGLETTVGGEGVGVAESGLLVGAPIVGDGVTSDTSNLGLRVLDDIAVLDVYATDLGEGAGGGVVGSEELGDDGDLLSSIDGLATAVEGEITHAVGVEIASGLVADAGAVNAVSALVQAGAAARVWGNGRRDGVGFPDIHLRAASAHATGTGVSTGGVPALNVGDTIDELDITRALRVAVTSTVLGTSLVGGVGRHTTVGSHLGEVDGTVETAGQLGDVDVEGELLVHQVEHLVLGVGGVHEIDTRADVGTSLEGEGEGVAAGGDTVSACVVGTIESAVRCTSGAVRAESGVPCAASVAVGVTGGSVEPAPVSVEDNGTLHGRAAASSGTCSPFELRVGFSCLGTDLLSTGDSEEGEGDEGGFSEHCENVEELS